MFLEGRGERLEEATQADLEDSLGDILRRRSANTAATRYKVMRVLYLWLEEEEELPNPMARMKPPIIPEQLVPIVPEDGLRRLLAACDGGLRGPSRHSHHHAAVELPWLWIGLRVG